MIDLFCPECKTKIQDWNGIKGNYTEITIEFTDNSAHETCMCQDCAYNVTIEQAVEIYSNDIQNLKKTDVDKQVPPKYWKFLEAKKVKAVKQGSRVI